MPQKKNLSLAFLVFGLPNLYGIMKVIVSIEKGKM
ncbi:hypothetical protein SCAZ3_04080 [Streptococcus canis FSL Z3-227]|uniref:Uncharacterized protein n=1 Tax=Streptococcus canis FSL Z3-227 TaxID=482234 RepID=A0AAV3FR39_STRCB|nr:hypothetical protein SCAZ3_04080 [Streptococcus canis FSL Z3-227]VTR79575.1 Uncharacterised protein [Streptococcus canis]